MHEEKLILYYYDDGLSNVERSEIQTAIKQDSALAIRYKKLRKELSGLTGFEVHAAPPDVVGRWHDSIDRAARADRNRQSTSAASINVISFLWGAAVTAALAVGVGIGIYFSASVTIPPDMPIATAETTLPTSVTIPAAFTRGLQVHLRDSQREISRLPLDANADRALLLMDIIAQNRLLERAAEQKNSPKLARVLRAFEPILLRLAAEDLAPEDVELLRAQLAFELNVMLTKLQREKSDVLESI